MVSLSGKNILGLENFSTDEIELVLETAKEMKRLAEKEAPLTSMMLSGKSDFHECRKKVFEE